MLHQWQGQRLSYEKGNCLNVLMRILLFFFMNNIMQWLSGFGLSQTLSMKELTVSGDSVEYLRGATEVMKRLSLLRRKSSLLAAAAAVLRTYFQLLSFFSEIFSENKYFISIQRLFFGSSLQNNVFIAGLIFSWIYFPSDLLSKITKKKVKSPAWLLTH